MSKPITEWSVLVHQMAVSKRWMWSAWVTPGPTERGEAGTYEDADCAALESIARLKATSREIDQGENA
jgi:hypothetical protein